MKSLGGECSQKEIEVEHAADHRQVTEMRNAVTTSFRLAIK